MNEFERKIFNFTVALQDMYKNEDDREGSIIKKMDLREETLTEDFTAMIYAQWVLYQRITGDDTDIFGFTHLCNRLIFQRLVEEKDTN